MSELDNCPKCKGLMYQGIAMGQTYVTGLPDFPGDPPAGSPAEMANKGQTIYPGGPGKLIECFKCEDCGFSHTA